jgi:hypothetical protein
MKRVIVLIILFVFTYSLVYSEIKNTEQYIKHDTIYVCDTIIKIIYRESIKNNNKIKGVWVGEIDGMEISLIVFKYTGDHSYLYEFNATISYNKYRGYIKEIIDDNIFKMNVNGNHAIWNIKFNNDKIIVYQSGFIMFPTMNEVELKRKA